jgi:predicted metal-dependent HD superfamily phosphohydrolase
MFQSIFIESIQKFIDDLALLEKLWSDIATHYSNSNRYYHNLAHLDHLAQELLKVKAKIIDWDTIVCSIAYHDIVYDTARSDNEDKSADYAASILSGILKSSQIDKIKQAILATKSHQYNNDPDINHFTDADLATLGASPEQYMDYSRQIRKEYQSYPDDMYKSGRQKVIEHFLNMDRIYKTSFFFDQYEKQARINLQMELSLLLTNN